MLYWNYRVIRLYDEDYELYTYGIHGVYYNEDGSVRLWTDNPNTPFGTELEELKYDVELFNCAIDKPVLELIVEGDEEKLVEVGDNG